MNINSIQIERSIEQQYCGTLDYTCDGESGLLLWTVDASPLKINVAFVQGSDENWDQIAHAHAGPLSDHLILHIARQCGLPALATPRLYPV